MESAKIFGVAEECHSSESGWTTYIVSPIHGDDSGDDDGQSDDHGDGDDDDDDYANSYNHEDGSDDSMASDASSGPSQQGIAHYRQEEDYKHQLKMKANKPVAMEKQKDGPRRRNEKKEETVFMGKRANNVSAESGSKARKNFWMGKRN